MTTSKGVSLAARKRFRLTSDDLWGYSSHLINECQRKGFTPYTVCQCYDTPMTMQLVQAGFGISYLPRSIRALTSIPSPWSGCPPNLIPRCCGAATFTTQTA